MDTIYKRFFLFLIGCIGTRILFVIIAKNIYNKYLPYLGYLAMVPAIGFIYIYLTNSRQTGAEVFGGKIWWNNIRPIHGLLYGMFAYNAIKQNSGAYKYLLVDVIIGLISFLMHHKITLNSMIKNIIYNNKL
jgi:hypothetical protein